MIHYLLPMSKHIGMWATPTSHSILPFLSNLNTIAARPLRNTSSTITSIQVKTLRLRSHRGFICCGARRRAIYEDDEDEVDGEEEYGHNKEIAMLELYSQSAGREVLIVHAVVDEREVDVLIFKGFSSCLNYKTSPDPSRSVLPARAVIKSIDRIRGPFDPSNIEYIEKGITLESFKNRIFSS